MYMYAYKKIDGDYNDRKMQSLFITCKRERGGGGGEEEKKAYLYGSIPVAANAAMAFDMISLTTRCKFRDK